MIHPSWWPIHVNKIPFPLRSSQDFGTRDVFNLCNNLTDLGGIQKLNSK